MKLLLAVTVSVFLAAVPRVQHPDGASLGGRVTDEEAVPIPGARISVRSKFSGKVQVVRSNAAGMYRIAGLKQGRYSIFARAESYGSTCVFNVILYRGKHTNLDLVLTDSLKRETSGNCAETIRSTH
jgi:hypothetical protein